MNSLLSEGRRVHQPSYPDQIVFSNSRFLELQKCRFWYQRHILTAGTACNQDTPFFKYRPGQTTEGASTQGLAEGLCKVTLVIPHGVVAPDREPRFRVSGSQPGMKKQPPPPPPKPPGKPPPPPGPLPPPPPNPRPPNILVWGSQFRFGGVGVRVWGSGFRGEGLGVRG